MRAGKSEGRSPPGGSITSDREGPAPWGSRREDCDANGRCSAIGEGTDPRRPHCALHHQVHCERSQLPDAIIWATARRKNTLLVTRNIKDFPESEPDIRLPYRL